MSPLASLRAAADVLAGLPPKPERDARQQSRADDAQAAAREVRREFVSVHHQAMYDELTDGRTRLVGLTDLVYAAADLWPGLVPSRADIAAEREHFQSGKDGREVDQAILISAWLSEPDTGQHLIRAMLRPTDRALDLLPEFRRTGRVDLGAATVERTAGMALVTMTNDRYLNAEDDTVIAALEVAVDLALLDDEVTVGVLRGGPVSHPRHAGRRIFSSGINLTHLYQGQISYLDFMLRRELGPMHKMVRGHWLGAEKPWVGVVDSFAIGGGLQILLPLDCVIATDTVYFRLPAFTEGIIPGSANLRLARLLGPRQARKMIYWDERVDATSPEGRALCDRVVAESTLDEEVLASAHRLSNPAVISNRRMLLLADEPLETFRSYMAQYAWEQAKLLYSDQLVHNLERTWVSRRARR